MTVTGSARCLAARRGLSNALRAAARPTTAATSRSLSTISNDDYTELNLDLNTDTKVLTVRFDRESRLNALSEVMGNELHTLIDALRVRTPTPGQGSSDTRLTRLLLFPGEGCFRWRARFQSQKCAAQELPVAGDVQAVIFTGGKILLPQLDFQGIPLRNCVRPRRHRALLLHWARPQGVRRPHTNVTTTQNASTTTT